VLGPIAELLVLEGGCRAVCVGFPLSCPGWRAQFIISRCEEVALGASGCHSPVVPGSGSTVYHLTVRGSGAGCFRMSFPGRGAQFIISRCEEVALGASRHHSPVVPGSQKPTGIVPSLFSTEFSFTIILECLLSPNRELMVTQKAYSRVFERFCEGQRPVAQLSPEVAQSVWDAYYLGVM
jgi:hypothetical protein